MNTTAHAFSRFSCLLFAVFGTTLCLAMAEPPPGDEPISSESDVRPASEEPKPAGTAFAAHEERDRTLYLAIDQTADAIQNPSSRLWVDVRQESAYERVRIPGSLHMPLFAVKANEFLKTRSVVLVDDGYGSHVLEDEVRKLRDMGFADLSIWYGGLTAWHQLGGKLEGTVNPSLGLLPASALMDLRYVTDWLVVDAGDHHGARFPGVENIPFDPKRPDAFVSAVNSVVQSRPQATSILLVTEQGFYDPKLLDASERLWAFVYHLDGGWAGWQAYQQNMAAIQGSGTKASSSATRSGSPRIRGCRTCP